MIKTGNKLLKLLAKAFRNFYGLFQNFYGRNFYGVSMVEFKQVNVGQGNPGLLQVPISIVTRF